MSLNPELDRLTEEGMNIIWPAVETLREKGYQPGDIAFLLGKAAISIMFDSHGPEMAREFVNTMQLNVSQITSLLDDQAYEPGGPRPE
jgi:hypothetical protein